MRVNILLSVGCSYRLFVFRGDHNIC